MTAAFHKIHPPAGSRPGTLAVPPGSPPPAVYVTSYDRDGVEEVRVDDPAALAPFAHGERTCWIDVQGLGDEAVLRRIGEVFDLHPLALEDAVNVPQRAKSEPYDEHQLIVARMPIVAPDGHVDTPQVCLLVGPRWLLTFQERRFGFFDPVRQRIRAGLGPIRTLGPDYLAYALIDTLVDGYYPVAEDLSCRLEELEDDIEDVPGPHVLGAIHRIRRQLVVLRRIGWPQREAIRALVREETPFVTEGVRTYLRDTHDHIAQIMELVDSTHELAVGLSEVYLSHVSQRTNEVMKVLTIMASIFIPLTFIAGVYGMNFEYMPELGQRNAYFAVLAAMVAVAAGMLLYFRHLGWLGSPRGRARRSDVRP
jgi:magnesium transporter